MRSFKRGRESPSTFGHAPSQTVSLAVHPSPDKSKITVRSTSTTEASSSIERNNSNEVKTAMSAVTENTSTDQMRQNQCVTHTEQQDDMPCPVKNGEKSNHV